MTDREDGESFAARSAPDAGPSNDLWEEIEARMGVCPSFFKLSQHDRETGRALWAMAQRAYLDHPAGSLAKEQLFTYLSRFCGARYCVARHAGFLIGRGRVAGDPHAAAMTPDSVQALIEEPLPDEEELQQLLESLRAVEAPLSDWPLFDEPLGRPFRIAAALAFLRPAQSPDVLAALRRLLGPAGYERLILFLGFVRIANYWTEAHPEIRYEPDLERLLEEHRALEQAVLGRPPDTVLALRHRLEEERPVIDQVRAELVALRGTEAELAARFEHLDAITANAPVLIAELDTDRRYRFANRPYAALFGVTPAELIGRSARDVIGREAYEIAEPYMTAALAGERVEFEAALDRAPGEPCWLRTSYAPVRDAAQRVIGFVAGIVDITKHKLEERARIESEARLRAAQAASGIGIFDWDIMHGRIIWDERAHAIWGIAGSGSVRFEEFVTGLHPDDLLETRLAIERALDPDGDGEYDAEYRVIHRSTGKMTWVHATGQVSFVHGQPIRMLGAVFDVTQRREAEEAHALSEERLRLAADAAGFGTYYQNLDTGETEWSPEALAILGLDRTEEPNRETVAERLHPEDRERILRRVQTHLQADTEAELEEEFRCVRPGGSVRWVLAKGRKYYVEAENGLRPRIAAGTILDITARKQAEERQKLLVNELNHRVKNTLTVVQSLASQTLTSASGAPGSFGPVFSARLRALAAAHDLLTRGGWEGATLDDVVEGAVYPFRSPASAPGRICVEGPEFHLSPNAAVTLCLAFHELATNALKYGALSVEDGRVRIAWNYAPAEAPEFLVIDWLERGGPPVHRPSRQGFGSRLVERALVREFDGESKIEYEANGVRCRMRLKLSDRLRGHTA